jgi:hypothetical protein
MDYTLRRGECALFSGIGEVGDWRLRAYQDQLTKFLKLLDSMFEHVLNSIDFGTSCAALQAGKG